MEYENDIMELMLGVKSMKSKYRDMLTVEEIEILDQVFIALKKFNSPPGNQSKNELVKIVVNLSRFFLDPEVNSHLVQLCNQFSEME